MSSLTEFQKKRTRLKNELEIIDWQLKNVLDDDQLKNSNDVIELQIKRLKLLDKLKYFRPLQNEDIIYRKNILDTFPFWAMNNIPEDMYLIFHGTTLANTERIINSARITSGKDRWTIHTSGDSSGEISVTTKDFLEISLQYYMNLINEDGYEYYLPSGCLFVLKTNKDEYKKARKDHRGFNTFFKKTPDRLYAIITTPENIKRVKRWMEKNALPSEKVMNFESFQEKIANLTSKQIIKKDPVRIQRTILKERT